MRQRRVPSCCSGWMPGAWVCRRAWRRCQQQWGPAAGGACRISGQQSSMTCHIHIRYAWRRRNHAKEQQNLPYARCSSSLAKLAQSTAQLFLSECFQCFHPKKGFYANALCSLCPDTALPGGPGRLRGGLGPGSRPVAGLGLGAD